MRVCLICVEMFGWGKYGGFGKSTRIIGRELARRGVSVSAVVPRRSGQRPVEDLDGIRVLSFNKWNWLSLFQLCRQANADIYHSIEPSLSSYLAMRAMPDRKHIVTFHDPRMIHDWITELRLPSLNYLQVLSNWFYEDSWLVQQAVRRMDRCFTTAWFTREKTRAKYHLQYEPEFLPTPVVLPEKIEKASTPTVLYLARLDKRKRPQIFFELTKSFPQVRFLVAGKARDPEYERELLDRYGSLPNLEMLGLVNPFRGDEHSRLLGKSWILVNTAAREGLPNAFFEAAAHACAILSSEDPDDFTSRFGYTVREGDYVSGLTALLKDDLWKERGQAGYEYVRRVYAADLAIQQHLDVYAELMQPRRSDPIGQNE